MSEKQSARNNIVPKKKNKLLGGSNDQSKIITIVYQTKDGGIALRSDINHKTVWTTLQQIADIFDTDKSGISRHIKNIYESGELTEDETVANFATVQIEGNRRVKRNIVYYNLDLVISVGYRVNSKIATRFRQWATKTLRQHISQGYTINKTRLANHYDAFHLALAEVQHLVSDETLIPQTAVLSLVKTFAQTWFSLDSYDKHTLPEMGIHKKCLTIQWKELSDAIKIFRSDLIKKQQASSLFAQEKNIGAMEGIFGSILQSAFEIDCYPSVEEKAAYLLYFTVKNHPFNDGNKRTGAFVFIWFLQRVQIGFRTKITPEALTALTLLVAQSKPRDKDRIIGLLILVLKQKA